MKKRLVVLVTFAFSVIYSNAQSPFGVFGEIVEGTVNTIERKKEENNKRRGEAPVVLSPVDLSLPMIVPSNETGYVKPDPASSFNKEHAGEIVFSKVSIPKDISSSDKLTNSFNMTDGIQMRFFMETNLCNYYLYTPGNNIPKKNTKAYYTTLLYFDDDTLHPMFTGDKYLSKEITRASTFRDAIIALGEQKIFNNPNVIDKFNNFSVGVHKIRVELWAGDIVDANSPRSLKPVASGRFTLVKKGNQKIHKGATMADVTPGMSNPELEVAALNAINDYARAQSWKEKYTELIITGREWSVMRNELTGVILGRSLDVYAKGVWPDGHCSGVYFSVAQQYDGSGYSKICNYYGIGGMYPLECD